MMHGTVAPAGARFRLLGAALLGVLAALTGITGVRADEATKPEAYKIQPGDAAVISVVPQKSYDCDGIVLPDGTLFLKRIGVFKASGLTVGELKEQVQQALDDKLVSPKVSITITPGEASQALVYGEVAKPGPVKLRMGAKLLDVLAEAGQPTAGADPRRIAIIRKESGAKEIVDLPAILKDPTLNPAIKPGDTITVPSKVAQSVRVDGEVRAIATIPLETARTVYTAVMLAGATDRTDWSRIQVRHKDSSTPVTVDLSGVRTGEVKDDLAVQEGDEITVLSKFRGTAKISGEIKTPGTLDLTNNVQLSDLILVAGGFTPRADARRVQVRRPGQPVQVVDLIKVARGTRNPSDPDLQVLPGDVVFVPTGTAVLRGEVKTPGEWPLGSVDNLVDFIAAAGGGFTENADRTAVEIIRDGKVARTVNVQEAVEGNKGTDGPEFELLPGDTVNVKNDYATRFVIVGGVTKPGRYQARPGMTLIDAISEAGGLRGPASHIVVVPAQQVAADGTFKMPAPASGKGQKGQKADPTSYGMWVIDGKRLLSGDRSQNVRISKGDRILIPEEVPGRRGGLMERLGALMPLAGLLFGGF